MKWVDCEKDAMAGRGKRKCGHPREQLKSVIPKVCQAIKSQDR